MKIFKYTDFINESKLELLLESNIIYTPEFISILKEIKSPISDKLLSIKGKDVDVNTNFIEIDKDKDSVVKFIPDNRLKLAKYITTESSYIGVAEQVQRSELYEIKNIREPNAGRTGTIIKHFTLEEICKINRENKGYWISYYMTEGRSLVHFKFEDGKGEGETIIDFNTLMPEVSKYTRSEISIGRFVKKILDKAGEKVSDKEIEDFVSKYKLSIQLKKDALNRLKIVKGEDIRKFYLYENYEEHNGSLGNSCMRYEKCQKYLDIYTKNPEQVSMVVLMSGVVNDKISGRAILWIDNKGRKFMDRIYTNKSPDEFLFIEYANKNGLFYKQKQESSSDFQLMFNGENYGEFGETITVNLPKFFYSHYPYMDTLKYYNYETGVITNNSSSDYSYELQDVNGGNNDCENCGGDGRVECPNCDGDGRVGCNECDGRGSNRCGECGGTSRRECIKCEGSGLDGDTDCKNCDGKGDVLCQECTEGRIECSDCNGSGDVECPECDGVGRVGCGECG